MPELPEIKALGERLDPALSHSTIAAIDPIGFSALRTVRPAPSELAGARLQRVTSKGKYLVLVADNGMRLVLHLGQAGRVDLEDPPRRSRGRGAVVRVTVGAAALFLREYGTERRAAWWVLAWDDDGPLATLGPEPDEAEFARFVADGDDSRHLHTMLRDQHTVAGIGRGYTDDILHQAQLSPFASLSSLDPARRVALRDAIRSVLVAALSRERLRSGGLSDARLGDRFAIHNRAGQPCPRCGVTMARVSFTGHEITYCPTCQTGGRVLADRRLSRLLR